MSCVVVVVVMLLVDRWLCSLIKNPGNMMCITLRLRGSFIVFILLKVLVIVTFYIIVLSSTATKGTRSTIKEVKPFQTMAM